MSLLPGAEEALRRLRGILDGSTVVESDLFPRLVQALVRLTGPEGEGLFSERLLRERSPLMAALLVQTSVAVLGHRAVDLLVKGALGGVNLERIRASTQVLAQLGTHDAHDALEKLAKELRHPVARELAASRLDEVEQNFPARYRLLPRLRRIEAEDPEALYRKFSTLEDRETTTLLLEAFPELSLPGRILACRLLELHGDARAGRLLQERLAQGVEPELFDPLFRCLREILQRHPDVAGEDLDRWARMWKDYGDREEAAHAVAIALTLQPDPKYVATYGQFLQSALEPVRAAGLAALAALPDPAFEERIGACFTQGSLREKVAALRALAALGKAGPAFDRAAKAQDPLFRQAAAAVALEMEKREEWTRLTDDGDEAVVAAAFDAVGRTPANRRPGPRDLEKILMGAHHPKTFEGACHALGLCGDRDSARQIIATLLRPEPWVREPVARALKALRGRGVFRWEDLDPPARKRMIEAIGSTADALALSLVGSFMEDLPLQDLRELKRRLFSVGLPTQGSAQAILMAMVGRTHILEAREKAVAFLEETLNGPLPTPARQVEALRQAALVWLRGDIDLGAEVSEKFERRMTEAAENKALSPAARGIAIESLGKAASAQALGTLKRLRSHPTEQISLAAEAALEQFSRRHPALLLEEAATPSRGGAASAVALLVVEDDANTRKIYLDFLNQKGYRAVGAADGAEALRLLRSSPVDVILLDLQMEGMDGFEFLEKSGHMPDRPPVVVITGLSDRNSVVRVLRMGAKDYLRKPVDLLQLCARVERALV